MGRALLGRFDTRFFALHIALAFVVISVIAIPMSPALFTDQAASSGSVITSGTWNQLMTTLYLHNIPTPPSFDTNAQAPLRLSPDAPTATTLYRYSKNLAPTATGRWVDRGGSGVNETNLSLTSYWQSSPAMVPQVLNGTASWIYFACLDQATVGRGRFTAYIRVLQTDSTYRNLANVTINNNNWNTCASWVQRTLSWTINTTLAVGERIEIKVVVSNLAVAPMRWGYDTTSLQSRITLP
jgi:hypothetical protein